MNFETIFRPPKEISVRSARHRATAAFYCFAVTKSQANQDVVVMLTLSKQQAAPAGHRREKKLLRGRRMNPRPRNSENVKMVYLESEHT